MPFFSQKSKIDAALFKLTPILFPLELDFDMVASGFISFSKVIELKFFSMFAVMPALRTVPLFSTEPTRK